MPISSEPPRPTTSETTLVTHPTGTAPTDQDLLTTLFAADDVTTLDLLVVTDTISPDDWIRALGRAFDDRPGNLGFVSVGDSHRSTASVSPSATGPSAGNATKRAPDLVTPVAEPADTPGIAMVMNEYLDAWSDSGRESVVLFGVLPSVFRVTTRAEGMKSCHVFRHLIANVNGRGYFFLTPATVDAETGSVLRTTFDDVVEYGKSETIAPAPGDDPLMELLADATRRRIVEILIDEERLSVSDLVDRLHDRGVASNRDILDVEVFHIHLPKLADAAILTFDRSTETVALSTSVDQVDPYLELARD